MSKSSNIFEQLGVIATILPVPIYWVDTNSVILGANHALLKSLGAPSPHALIGKSFYDIYPYHIADSIKQHNDEVIQSTEPLMKEEKIKDITTGKTKYFNVIKAILRDEDAVIIGIVSICMETTAQNEAARLAKDVRILKDLDKIASIIPAPIYWEDINSIILGGNEAVFKGTGAQVRDAYVGKSLYELYPEKMASHIKQHNEEVMRTGEILSQEEAIEDISTGELKYFTAVKAPLYNEDGNIIGIVGTSIDITKQKEAERLKLENEIELQEQEKFTKIANQVAHDIRSPLASLLMIVKSCTQIPETDRIALREAAIGIGDIANHLLSKYQKKETDNAVEVEERQPIFVSAILLQLLAEKKYQYQKSPIKFGIHFNQNTHFSFIKIEPSAFKRMISNLINNAVDAFDNRPGQVDLKLEVDNEWVSIVIQDNGKGMPPQLVDKIMNKISVTTGKKSGHGIGLNQVWETLERNQGELSIDSTPGQGTLITIKYPKIKAPGWIAEEIILGSEDVVVILDDDTSIHGAWRTRFEPILSEAPKIQLHHFQIGKEALEFINTFSQDETQKVFLLTDYELLKQEFNGLHIVEQSKVKRSILVTSHYANLLVQEQAAKTGTKILPKQLASEITIKILNPTQSLRGKDKAIQIEAVIVDDDESFLNSLLLFAFDPETTDKYYSPEHFLDSAHKYTVDTKIYLDNNYALSRVKGLQIAEELHRRGYKRLYILSGEVFNDGDIPDYVTLIKKDNIESIKDL